MILSLSHAWLRRTLTWKHWHRSIQFLFERRICSIDKVNFFPLICNCGFGIWLIFDAVLRYSRATMCGIAVFVPPLRPPRPHPMLTVWSSCSVPLFFLLLIQHDGWRVPGVRARNLIELPAIMKQEDRGGGSGFALWGLQVTIENRGYPSQYFRLKRGNPLTKYFFFLLGKTHWRCLKP